MQYLGYMYIKKLFVVSLKNPKLTPIHVISSNFGPGTSKGEKELDWVVREAEKRETEGL